MQWLIDLLVQSFLKQIIAYISDAWAKMKKQKEADAEIDKQTSQQSDNLKQSETDKEFEDAAKNILGRHD